VAGPSASPTPEPTEAANSVSQFPFAIIGVEYSGVTIFRPRGVVPRIVRQGGLFTIHGPPDRSLESLTRDKIVTLDRILIAEPYRLKLRSVLARYGIHSASLFPDLDGLSSYLNWKVESGEIVD
jgi:hypothetical protein